MIFLKSIRRYFLALLFFTANCFSQSASLFEHFTVKNGLASEKIYDILQTNDGNIWLATAKGICRFDGISFYCYNENNGLRDSEIIGLLSDRNGKLWCWNASAQIFYFENNNFSPLEINAELQSKIANRIINSVSIDKENNFWLGTVIAGELLKISGNRISEINPDEKKNFSFFVKQTDERNFVFGSLKTKEENNKLMVFLNEKKFPITLSGSGNFSKQSFFPVSQNEFLYAKGQEIIHFKNEKIIQRSFAEKNIQEIMRDSEGKIWVGLYTGGAICYPEGILASSGTLNYLGSKSVSSVLEDKAGNIWFATLEDGIYYLPVRSNLVYSAPQIYSEKNSGKEENPKAITPEEFRAQSGLYPETHIISTDTVFENFPPAIFITGLKIMEQDTLIQNHYDLPFDKNFLKINFAGFSYGNSQALKYKYRMEGIDKSWIYTDNTSAQYTTLPAGKYFFSVSAMNKNGIWSDSSAGISFIIEPPFWKTWWFVLLSVLMVSGAIASVFFIRISQIKKREKEKSEIAKQMANAELQALRTQMNPHFIFNTMSSIQHFITTNETEAALKYLSKFAKLMRKIMDNSKKTAIAVKDELDALQLYLELETLRFKNKFDFSMKVDEKIDVNDDEIPPMLIQPYVENSILHGIMNKEGKGNIFLEIKKENEMLVCIVEDNGIGREKAKEINAGKKNEHISSGMSITKNRLEILNALHHSNLNVNVIDLKDREQNALGTRVEIFVPL